jgi:Domain of unknown function (DUF5069)
MEPLDLTVAPPRSPRVTLDGLAMLARTIDKMRAGLPGGKLGDYHVDGMSVRMLKIIGVDADALQEAVARSGSEDEVVAWVRANADTNKYPEATHVMLHRCVDDIDPERLPEFAKKYPGYAAAPSGKLVDIIDADDAAVFGKTVADR